MNEYLVKVQKLNHCRWKHQWLLSKMRAEARPIHQQKVQLIDQSSSLAQQRPCPNLLATISRSLLKNFPPFRQDFGKWSWQVETFVRCSARCASGGLGCQHLKSSSCTESSTVVLGGECMQAQRLGPVQNMHPNSRACSRAAKCQPLHTLDSLLLETVNEHLLAMNWSEDGIAAAHEVRRDYSLTRSWIPKYLLVLWFESL